MARKKPLRQRKINRRNKSAAVQQKSILNKVDLTWVLFGILTIVVLVIRLKFISIPFERDEGTYAYFGQLVLDGKVPYKDFYEMKLPGIYYSYAILIAIFGGTLKGLHTGFMLVNLATVFLMFKAGTKLFNKQVGLVVATSCAILAMNPHISGFTTQAEHLIAFFVSAALVLLLKGIEKESLKLYLFSGMFFCASMLIKQNGLFFVLFGGLAISTHYLLNKQLDWKKFFKSGIVFTAGAAIPLLVLMVIIALQGAFDEMIYWTFKHPSSYVGALSWNPEGKENLVEAWVDISRNQYLLFLLSFAGMVVIAFTKMSWHRKGMIWAFGILSFLSIFPGLRFYGHYWIALMPAIGILTGAAVFGLEEILTKFIKGSIPKFIALGIFAISLVHHFAMVRADESIERYYSDPDATNVLRNVYGLNPFPEAKKVSTWIKRNSDKDDRIAVFGSEPQLYFYSNRRGVSKHNYCSYLVQDYSLSAEWQKEYLEDVEAAMPRYLVFFRQPVSWSARSNADMTIFTWFDAFSRANYDLVGMTQVVTEKRFDQKWGRAEVARMSQDLNVKEKALRNRMNAAIQSGNQQEADKLKNQLDIYYYQVLVFERKAGIVPGS